MLRTFGASSTREHKPVSFAQVFSDDPSEKRGKIFVICVMLVLGNALAWTWAFFELADRPALFAIVFLAYTFGLRHAVDADHIAAIDNVVRKLMQEGKRPLSVGFFFSLGHSTVVVLATIGIAATAALLQNRFEPLKAVGGIIGTSVSIFSRYLGRTITMSALLTIAIVGLWAGAVYEPTAITFLSREAGMAPPDAAKMASYGTGLLSVGTILGCIAAPWLAERLGRRPTLAL